MPYNKFARALRTVASILEEEKTFPLPPYKIRSRRGAEEAPAREFQWASHATEEEHRTAEEFQWRESSTLQRWIIFLTVLAVFFSAITLIFTLKQVSDGHQTVLQATRQADIAKWSLDNSNRPWLFVSTLSGTATSVHYTILNIDEDHPAIMHQLHTGIGKLPDSIYDVSSFNCSKDNKDVAFVKYIGPHPYFDCAPKLPIASSSQFFGFIIYEGTNGVRWRRQFDYVWDEPAAEWIRSSNEAWNADLRVDQDGKEVFEPS